MRSLIAGTGVKLGTTAHGNAWAHRVLHPNDDSVGGGMAIPDNAQSLTAAIELRHSGVIGSPLGLADNQNWDLQIAELPFLDVPTVFRRKVSGADDWSDWLLMDPGSGAFPPGTFRVQNEIGGPGPAPLDACALLEETTQFRQSFRGITVVMNSNSLTDQGFVTIGQWGVKPSQYSMRPATGQITGEIQEIDALMITDVPDSPDKIINKCPTAGQWEARHGFYMPMRFNDPTHLFQSGDGSEWRVFDAGDTKVVRLGKPIILAPSTNDETAVVDNVFDDMVVQGDAAAVNWNAVTTAGTINMNFGTAIFSGIDKKASFVVKVRYGAEVVAGERMPLAKAMMQTPDKDQVALDAAQEVANRLPLVMEHKYNSLGLIAGLIASAARTALPVIMPWLSGKLSKFFGGGVPAT
jgi:hypothetical protein